MPEIANAIDKLESLIYGIRTTDEDSKTVKGNLIGILRELKEGYIKKTGDNPWE